LIRSIDGVLNRFAGSELDRLVCRDLDTLTDLRIATGARGKFAGPK